MLRLLIIAAGVLLLAAGLFTIASGTGPATFPLLLAGVLILAGTLLEPHYKPIQKAAPGDGFTPTGECFHDPVQGGMVEVWYNAATGERRYVTMH